MHELVCFLSVGKCYYKGCCIIFKDLWLWLNRNKFCHYLTKPIITRIIVSLVFENVIVRTAVMSSEILWLWLNRNKFCHYLTKPIITRIIVSLVLENVLVRTAVMFSEILWLWVNRNKFCHYLTKPIIAWISVFFKCWKMLL